MKKGDVFSILRFEAKRLLRWEYVLVGLALLGCVWLLALTGAPERAAGLLAAVGSLLMVAMGLDLWRPFVSRRKDLVVSLLTRGTLLEVFFGLVAAAVFSGGSWRVSSVLIASALLFLLFCYLAGSATAVAVRGAGRRYRVGMMVWIFVVFLIPGFLRVVIDLFHLPAEAALLWPESFFASLARGLSGGATGLEAPTRGFVAGALYVFFLAVAILYFASRRRAADVAGERVAVGMEGFERGKFYFLHMNDPRQREAFVRFFEAKDAVAVKRPCLDDLDGGVRLKDWVEWLSGLRGKELESLLLRLGAYGIDRRHWRRRLGSLPDESLPLAYLGVMLDRQAALFVFDDFLAGCPDVCRGVFQVKLEETLAGAAIIYIGGRMYETRLAKTFGARSQIRFIAVDPAKIEL